MQDRRNALQEAIVSLIETKQPTTYDGPDINELKQQENDLIQHVESIQTDIETAEQDFEDAKRATEEYRAAGFDGHVYLMPVGGVESVYALNNKNVALLAMKNGLRYSDRLQVPLFKNEWGT